MRKLFSLAILFLLTFQQLVFPAAVFAEQCCPEGYTRGDAGILGAAGAAACGDPNHYNSNWCCSRDLNPLYGSALRSVECPDSSSISCEWTYLNNPSSQYNGKPAFCVGGFTSESQLQSSSIDFDCTDACGGAGSQIRQWWQQSSSQTYPLTGAIAGSTNDTYYTCVTGDFDSSVQRSIKSCLERKLGAEAGAGLSLGAIGLATGPFSIITIPALTTTGVAVGNIALGDCEPEISAVAKNTNGVKICEDKFRINIDLEIADEKPSSETSNTDTNFYLCKQIPEGDLKDACDTCVTKDEGIWTAVGCIKTDPTDIVQAIMTVGISIAGGVALLMFLAAGFMLSVSQGEPKRTSDAKEMLTSAIIGLLFIIFSVTILQFIGVDILRIPGFGGQP